MLALDRFLEIALTNAGAAAVLAMVAALAQLWLRRPAIVRGLWLLVLLKLMMPPIYELGIPVAKRVAPLPRAVALAAEGPAFTAPVAAPTRGPILTTETAALGLWLLGVLGLTTLAVIRTTRFQEALADAEPASPALQDRVDTLATGMGIGRSPRAVVVKDAISPMLWALPRSFRLILPKALINQLSTREIDTLIAHELAHLRRGDHWVRYLEMVATALYWWHPAAWWASRHLRRAEEECCDSLVAETLPEHRRAYADCLIKTMKYLAQAGRAPYALDSGTLATGAGEVQNLQRRLTMIMKRRTQSTLPTPLRAVLTLTALALLAVFPTVAGSGGSDVESTLVTEVNPRFSGQAMDFNPQGASLGDVLRELAAKTALNVVIDAGVDLSSPVTTRFQGIPWGQILSTVINDQALSYRVEGNVVWISAADVGYRKSDFIGEPISINLDHADLRETLKQLADQGQIRIELDPGIEGQVSLHLEDVPWDQVVDTILRINHLGHTVEGTGLKVFALETE